MTMRKDTFLFVFLDHKGSLSASLTGRFKTLFLLAVVQVILTINHVEGLKTCQLKKNKWKANDLHKRHLLSVLFWTQKYWLCIANDHIGHFPISYSLLSQYAKLLIGMCSLSLSISQPCQWANGWRSLKKSLLHSLLRYWSLRAELRCTFMHVLACACLFVFVSKQGSC